MINAARSLLNLPQCPWLTGDRALGYARVFLIISALVYLPYLGVSLVRGGWDPSGKIVGTDFLCFWTAAKLALSGAPAEAYRADLQAAFQAVAFPGSGPGYYAFIYPPVTLLLCLPLGLFPYGMALVLWLLVTGSAYFSVVWTLIGRVRALAPAVLAFPAVLVNCGHGQNGFLTAALFGGAVLSGPKRPVLAGCCLGALVIKPHLALLVPVALLAGGWWVTLAAAAMTAAGLVLLSILILGPETWVAYSEAARLARTTLEQGLVEPEKMQSVFAAIRLWGGSLGLAYGLQLATALAVAVALVVVVRRSRDWLTGAAALTAGSLLATPYLLDYDLTILAVPLSWLVSRGRQVGFLPWEKTTAAAVFCLPLISRLVATSFAVPLGPVGLVAIFILVSRRAFFEADGVRAAEAHSVKRPKLLAPA